MSIFILKKTKQDNIQMKSLDQKLFYRAYEHTMVLLTHAKQTETFSDMMIQLRALPPESASKWEKGEHFRCADNCPSPSIHFTHRRSRGKGAILISNLLLVIPFTNISMPLNNILYVNSSLLSTGTIKPSLITLPILLSSLSPPFSKWKQSVPLGCPSVPSNWKQEQS